MKKAPAKSEEILRYKAPENYRLRLLYTSIFRKQIILRSFFVEYRYDGNTYRRKDQEIEDPKGYVAGAARRDAVGVAGHDLALGKGKESARYRNAGPYLRDIRRDVGLSSRAVADITRRRQRDRGYRSETSGRRSAKAGAGREWRRRDKNFRKSRVKTVDTDDENVYIVINRMRKGTALADKTRKKRQEKTRWNSFIFFDGDFVRTVSVLPSGFFILRKGCEGGHAARVTFPHDRARRRGDIIIIEENDNERKNTL